MRLRNFKGLPLLRTLIFGTLITMAMTFAIFYFAGGALSNYGHTNSTLAGVYNTIKQNTTSPNGGVLGVGALNNQLNGQTANYTKPDFVTTLVNTLSSAASFSSTILPTAQAMLTLAGSVFGYFGIPSGYFLIIGQLMLVAIIALAVLAIWSAVYS